MDVKAELQGNLSPELLEALRAREEIIMFYKLGFLDAWIEANNIKIYGRTTKGHNREQRLFERISDKCRKRFDARFMKGINKQINKVREGQAK